MRVLHAIHDYLPAHRSGSEIYAHALARALGARGHQVEVVCAETDLRRSSGSIVEREVDGLPVTEIVNNWEVGRFAQGHRPPALAAPLAALLLRRRPEVLHLHSLLNLSFDLPAMARRAGVPVVATLHDFTLFCPSGGQRVHVAERHVCREIDFARCARCFRQTPFHQLMATRPRRVRPRWLARWTGGDSPPDVSAVEVERRFRAAAALARDVDCFVAPSRALAADVVRFGLPAEKVEVSDYGFEPLAPAPREPSNGPLRIGFVGTLIWHKGAHVLVEALRRLPRDAFVARFHGPLDWFPDYVRDLRAAAAGLPVEFAGGFGPGEAAAVLSRLDVVVVPSLWPENSPLVIHEAFQAGVPVVGARTGGIPELVADGVCGLTYAPESAEELAAALASLLGDRARLARFAAALPPVKAIASDAAEWEARYERARRRAAAA
jgi:glycosyltransferase involved in cell wall biosynthesis